MIGRFTKPTAILFLVWVALAIVLLLEAADIREFAGSGTVSGRGAWTPY